MSFPAENGFDLFALHSSAVSLLQDPFGDRCVTSSLYVESSGLAFGVIVADVGNTEGSGQTASIVHTSCHKAVGSKEILE